MSTHLRRGLLPARFPLCTTPFLNHKGRMPISFSSPAQYWMRSTDHLAPRYAISFIPLSPRPSWVQII